MMHWFAEKADPPTSPPPPASPLAGGLGASETDTHGWKQVAGRGLGVAVCVVASLAFAAGIASLLPGRTGATVEASEDYAAARHEFSENVAENYDFKFGKDKPFLPSNATTDTGEFLDPKTYPSAAYCGHCHREAHAQWRESAHSNSFRTPWYKKNVNLLMSTKGNEYARHCEGCHNPLAMLSGTITKGASQKRPTDDDGITCSVCHSIQSVDKRGTGSYVLGPAAVMVDEAGKPIYWKKDGGNVSDAEILAHLDRHSAAVMKPIYKTTDFCGACHKAALPQQLNDYKWQRAIFLSDEWQNSSFAKQSPLPFYVKPTVSTCQTCHMMRETLNLPDPGAKEGKLASHRWLGANTLLPTYYKYDTQLRKTTAFLQNGVFNVDLFALQSGAGQKLVAPLGTQKFELHAGDPVTVSVVIQNKGAAHSHVPEQRDMYESWVQFTVKGPDGRTVMESGFLKADGSLDERAHSFTNRLINKQGTLNDLHQVWANRVVAYNNTIQSGRSQLVRYEFRVPPTMSAGDLTVTAQVNYRRFNQHFINFGLKEGYQQPVVVMASRTRVLHVGANDVTPVDPADNPLWMRWNNYGIGLLDAQQYAASVAAFEHVAKLRPEYPDAYTNIALANFQWEKYDVARVSLEKALSLIATAQAAPPAPALAAGATAPAGPAPMLANALATSKARALYYLALVERNEGNLDGAIEDLKQVAEAFPYSRDAHRELGFSYYQQHKYADAKGEYLLVQGIDPDDLAAHYNLAILYRRLGMKAEAAMEAAKFADQKDDPTANTYALEYLRKHDEIAAESVPWHLHGDVEPGAAKAGGGH